MFEIQDPLQIRISDCYNYEHHTWNWTVINALHLPVEATSYPRDINLNSSVEDKWIWAFGSSGSYTVKAGYQLVYNLEAGHQFTAASTSNRIWHILWKLQDIQPKILVFCWRFAFATETVTIYSNNFSNVSIMCIRTGIHNTFVLPVFFCQTSLDNYGISSI